MKGNIWLVPKAVILLKESNLFSGWMSTPPWVQGHGRQMTTSPLIWKPCSLPHSPPSHSCLAKKNVFPKKKFSKMLLCWPTLRFILVSSLCLVPLFKKESFSVALFFRLCYLCIWSECAQRCLCAHSRTVSLPLPSLQSIAGWGADRYHCYSKNKD